MRRHREILNSVSKLNLKETPLLINPIDLKKIADPKTRLDKSDAADASSPRKQSAQTYRQENKEYFSPRSGSKTVRNTSGTGILSVISKAYLEAKEKFTPRSKLTDIEAEPQRQSISLKESSSINSYRAKEQKFYRLEEESNDLSQIVETKNEDYLKTVTKCDHSSIALIINTHTDPHLAQTAENDTTPKESNKVRALSQSPVKATPDKNSPQKPSAGSSNANVAQNEENEEVFCRICKDDESEGKLMMPCNCRGSIAYSHSQCLQKWIECKLCESALKCEICKVHYRIISRKKLKKSLLAEFIKNSSNNVVNGILLMITLVGLLILGLTIRSLNSMGNKSDVVLQAMHYVLMMMFLVSIVCIVWFYIKQMVVEEWEFVQPPRGKLLTLEMLSQKNDWKIMYIEDQMTVVSHRANQIESFRSH